DLKPAATRAVAEYRHALHLLRPASRDWTTEVRAVSALTRDGIAEAWAMVERHRAIMVKSGDRAGRRAEQARAALWREIGEGLMEAFKADKAIAPSLAATEERVAAGEETALAAARRLLSAFLKPGH
ncbi:MAG: methylmalonyl Co-A mutase-associated GTPase MeaB, partial [Acidobacteriota bacterium]